MNSLPYNTRPLSQLTLGESFILASVLALILAVGVITEQFYFAMICCGAAVGMFFAEYFGSTRHREFVFLVFLPSAFSCITTILLLLLQSPDSFDITIFAIWGFLGTVLGIIPAVLSVIALSTLSKIVFRLTGLRFLKFDWNPDQ